ncbi:hypothetical protein BKA93DRAFT_828154 [Sparassis latifolia]
MHLCFSIAKVVDSIVAELSQGGSLERASRAEDFSALAALTSTSRFFHTLAANIQWHSQLRLSNLVKCMPGDLGEERNGALALIPSDWERFDLYARRVKMLTFDGYGVQSFMNDRDVMVSVDTFRLLNEHVGMESFLYCQLFFGPKLQKFALRTGDPDLEWVVVCALVHLHGLVPCLQTLHLDVSIGSGYFSVELPGFLRGFSSLQRFIYKSDLPMSSEAFLHLFSLPHPIQLDITCEDENQPLMSPLPTTTIPETAFPVLKTLCLAAESMRHCAAILKVSRFLHAEKVVLHTQMPENNSTDNLHAVLKLLLAQIPHDSLKELVITSVGVDGSEEVINLRCLFPLQKISNLQSLCLDTECRVVVDDAGLETLAKAWPNLQKLFLIQGRSLASFPVGVNPTSLDHA